MVKIGFIGCHIISWHCLQKICNLSKKFNDEIKLVYNLESNEAEKHSGSIDFDSLQKQFSFDLKYVVNVSDSKNIEYMKNANLDILFIIGWHRIVPQEVLDTAKFCLGIHSSVLPKDRGPSPINWQLIKGDKEGGVTLFHLATGVDSGPIVDSKGYEISNEDDVNTVYSKAIIASIEMLENNWSDIHNLVPKTLLQNESLATFNERRKPNDGLIDWTKDSKSCFNFIRALTIPYPGAFSFLNKQKIMIWKSKISNEKETTPGKIIECEDSIKVSTGNGCIELISLQVENEPICDAKLFLKSYQIKYGDMFKTTI
jgi:methionyl-tRNA formyltransferase